MKKYQLFTVAACVLLFFGFTVPIAGFHGVQAKIQSGNTEAIPAYAYPIWNLYNTGRYVSPVTPKEARGDLKKMIDRRAEIGVASLPIWYVSLEAPNYPKDAFPNGIPVYFHFDGYSGDVHEMDTINHYIGMYPMAHGGQLERKLAPYAMVAIPLMMILFLIVQGRFAWLLMVPAIALPFGFLGLYAGWLYWYGHNLQEWGAFTVKPFMPTVLGDGKVAQFVTHSYPSVGFWLLVVISVLSVLAVFSQRKALKEEAR